MVEVDAHISLEYFFCRSVIINSEKKKRHQPDSEMTVINSEKNRSHQRDGEVY